MAIKIAFSNFKGGISKTSSSLCLADSLRRKGKKVLLIDIDPQGSSSSVYHTDESEATLGDIIYNDSPASECIQHCPLGDIISSDRELMDADQHVKIDARYYFHLSKACRSVEDMYDIIIMDCPPGNGVLLSNVYTYTDFIIVPVTMDKFGVQGLDELTDVIKSYHEELNPRLKVLGILITKYKGRQNLTKDLESDLIPQLAQNMDTRVFDTKIRESVKCQEAQAMSVSLYDYAPNSTVARDYDHFADEVLKELNI